MTNEDRIDSLKARHRELEEAIDQEENKPNPDEIQIHDLKKRKLAIKDELLGMGAA